VGTTAWKNIEKHLSSLRLSTSWQAMQFTDAEPGEMDEVERMPGCKDMAISGPRATSGIEKVCQADRIAQDNTDQDENEPLMLEQDLKLELEI